MSAVRGSLLDGTEDVKAMLLFRVMLLVRVALLSDVMPVLLGVGIALLLSVVLLLLPARLLCSATYRRYPVCCSTWRWNYAGARPHHGLEIRLVPLVDVRLALPDAVELLTITLLLLV